MDPISSFLLSAMLFFVQNPSDPILLAWHGRQTLRNLDCTQMSQAQAHTLYPGRVSDPAARTQTLTNIDAVVCQQRIIPYGERDARNELVLTTLRQSTGNFAQAAVAHLPKETVWYVDAFFPDAEVAARIAAATRTELVERGAKVSNRVPLLAAGDVLVLQGMPVHQAFSLACTRYSAERSLAEHEALLAVVLVDTRVSELHAGVCTGGTWRWLQ